MVVPPTAVTKSALRRECRAARAAYVAALAPVEQTRLEQALAEVLAAHLPPGVVAGYHAVGSEIGLDRCARVTLWPRVVPDGPLAFHAAPPAATLAVAGLGAVPQPAVDAPTGVPDILLVPLLAVDAAGVRLGQGGGHYDRTLAALREARPVLAVGVAWDSQRVAALPCDPWDAPLDALATPSGWHDFARAPMSPR